MDPSMTMPMSGSSSSSTSAPGMDMSADMDANSGMSMVFFEGFTTPLFTLGFRPATQGQYAAMCVFLIGLTTTHRLIIAVRSALAATYWAEPAARRLQSRAAARKLDAGEDADLPHEEAMGSAASRLRAIFLDQPFRVANETARAVFDVVIGGIGYLLYADSSAPVLTPGGIAIAQYLLTRGSGSMLAVMTMNVGYFLSVLGGIFLGSFLVGRFVPAMDH